MYLSLNSVPTGATSIVIPNSGVSLTTTFSISINGATDENVPYNYRIFMYLSESLYIADCESGMNLNGFAISGLQSSNGFSN